MICWPTPRFCATAAQPNKRGHHRYRAGWQPRQNPPYRLGLCAKNRGIGEKRSTARSNATVRLCSLHKFYPQLQTRNGPARLRTKSPLRFSIISMSHPCLTELPSPLGNARKIRGTNCNIARQEKGLAKAKPLNLMEAKPCTR